MKLGSLEKGYQLCFSCKNACGGCSWSRCGEPVDGWVATPTIILQNAEEKNSYSIAECPQYEYDGFCKNIVKMLIFVPIFVHTFIERWKICAPTGVQKH